MATTNETINRNDALFFITKEKVQNEAREKIGRKLTEDELDIANKGGTIAGDAKKKLEIETGRSVSTPENFLEQPESVKKLKLSHV